MIQLLHIHKIPIISYPDNNYQDLKLDIKKRKLYPN